MSGRTGPEPGKPQTERVKRMNRTGPSRILSIMTAASYILMVTVNALANILPINGVNTGQVSDAYPNLFAPAGVTFSIWGVIYILLGIHVLYQLGLFRDKGLAAHRTGPETLARLFILSSLANAVWIFAWHFGLIGLSLILMLVILVCLILISLMTRPETMTPRERFMVRLPFSGYFGWITVATIANVTTWLVSLGWQGFGIPETTWTVLVIGTGLLIGISTMLTRRDAAYGLVLIWAYGGIYLKHTSAEGFSGMYPPVITMVLACLALLVAAEAWLLISGNRSRYRM